MKNDIVKLLTVIAEQTGEQISGPRMAMMVSDLCGISPAEYDLIGALHRLRRKARRFPTIDEILMEAGATQGDEDKGREVAARIWSALSRYGSQKFDLLAAVGPIGVEVVRLQGGWMTICETATYDNAAILQAQWRELAEVVARKGRSGDLTALPQFDGANAPLAEALKVASARVIDISRKGGG